MNDSIEEIRQEEEQRTGEANQTPAVKEDGEGGSSGVSVPMPSISRKQSLIIGGVVVVLILVWYLAKSNDSGGNSSLDDLADADVDESVEAKGEKEDDTIHVPSDKNDPLAGDAAVTAELKERGVIGGGGT